ncbi:S-layer family protein [Shewanella sp. FJAT-52076]|uniref:beta strand repeat-containing protein n=1 Tax=Shewanella sp. FJAT-52076 TaxID=2864202 RepID=UPI001C65694D|nr:invasin [Shewanella sp. FJAT-52076]QYJ76662.1 invasin [Shewanella sp. FJAT-52076]
MKSAFKLWLATFLSFLLIACGGGGSISDTGGGDGGTPPTDTITVSVSISNTDIDAANPATVTANVTGSLSGAQAGKLVTFSLSNNNLGAFTPGTGTALTDASGNATIILSTADVPGAGTVKAAVESGESGVVGFNMKGDGGTSTGTGNVLQISLTNASGNPITTISAAQPGVVNATYKTGSGDPLVNKVVTFSSTLGKFNPSSGTALTNSSGVATISLTAGTVAGASSVTATAEQVNSLPLGFTTLGDEVPAKAIDPYSISLTVVDQSGAELRNVTQAEPGTVVATLTKDGIPANFERIAFVVDGKGTINPTSGSALTNANGEASVTLLTGSDAGAGTVTASFTLDGDSIDDSFNYQVAGDAPGGNGEANNLSIQLTSAVSGNQTSSINAAEPGIVTVFLTDKDNAPLAGKVVSFSSTLGTFLPNTGTALTDATGKASITVTAGSVEGAGEITANYGSTSAIVGFVTAGDEIDPVEASPEISFDIYDCNGVASWDKTLKNFEACTITDNITSDKPGIVGAIVTRSGSTQALKQVLVSATTSLGAISPGSGSAITNDDGRAVLDLYANGDVGAGEITLKVKDVSSTKAFEIGRVDITLGITDSLNGEILPAGGSTVLEVTVYNTDGSILTGQPFTLNFNSECQTAGTAIIDSPVVTNAGMGYATYRTTGCSGEDTVTVSAVTGGSAVIASRTITIDSVNVGSLEYVSATPKLLALRGTGGISGAGNRSETSVVAFKLLNEIAQPATQQKVCFELSTDVGGMTLSPQPLAEDYLDCGNFPKPADAEYPADITVPNKYAVAYTNGNGEASVVVKSGDVPTPVKVYAQWSGSNSTGHNGVISNISDELRISTGLTDNSNFSLSASVFNPEAWNYDGETSIITIRAADHFHNLVPEGTAISFRAEGGGIDGSCTTGVKTNGDPSGNCSVTWNSQDSRPFESTNVTCPVAFVDGTASDSSPPCTGHSYSAYLDGSNSVLAEPRPGRVTVTAYAIGEESFVDLNGNGLFDTGETYSDLAEAFTDHNEDGVYRGTPLPAGAVNEEFVDYNSNGTYDVADGFYTGLLCAAGSESACTDNGFGTKKAQLNVFRNLTLVMSGSTPMVRLTNIDKVGDSISAAQPIDLTVAAPQTVYLFLSDVNNNTLPLGTTITATTDNGELSSATSSYIIGNNSSNRPAMYPFTIGVEASANDKTTGTLYITIKTPKGDAVVVSLTVIDAG